MDADNSMLFLTCLTISAQQSRKSARGLKTAQRVKLLKFTGVSVASVRI